MVAFFPIDSFCDQGKSSNNPETVPLLYELMPGGTHFYAGDTAKGMAFLTAELSLLAGGIILNGKAESELNAPLLLAGQLYAVDKCDYSRKQLSEYLRTAGHRTENVICDTAPLKGLMSAPFRSEIMFTPFVLGCAMLGIIDGIVAYPHHPERLHDLRTVRTYGSAIHRDSGTFWYESSAAGLSWGAALSEEMLFRGILLPSLDYRFGKRTGLVVSSVIFGGMHIFNSDIDKPFYFIGQATAAGFAFGYQVQNNRYRLDKAIAAHFWYNIVSMTTTWLINPRENPLGFAVQFTL